MSVQPGGLYIHQFKKLVDTFISFSPCEKEMQANPLVARSRSRSHSSLSSDCFIRLTEKVYSQIRSISITVRDF